MAFRTKYFSWSRLTLVILVLFIYTICVTIYNVDQNWTTFSVPDIVHKFIKKPNFQVKTFFNQSIPPPGILIDSFFSGHVGMGIGNQLYVYACSYSLAKEKNWPLYIFINETIKAPSFANRTFAANLREFSLDQFQIPELNLYDENSTISNIHVVKDLDYLDGILPDVKGDEFILLKGNCESREFFVKYEEEIKKMFQPPDTIANFMSKPMKSVLSEIKETESVALHVRRGDFLKYRGGNAFFVPISYQRSAMRRMVKILKEKNYKPVFFVFSDDIEYAKGQFTDFEKEFRFVYVSALNTTSIQDFYLMTKCKHIIFPNSTFGWWAAFLNLNKEKIVIASAYNPEFWMIFEEGRVRNWRRKMNGEFYHPSSWIVIDPFSGEQ